MMHSHDSEQPGSSDINVGNVSGTGIAIGHGAQAIVTIYQTVLRPLPVKYSALVQPLIEHYTAVFGGRDAELAGLDAFLADPQHPFGLLVAPTGLGKTALLVHWIARVQQQHPQWRIIFAPVSIRYQTASEQVLLGLLAHSLAEFHHDLDQFRSYDQSPSSLRALITDYLRRPLQGDTPLLLVLDGIDEATGWMVGPLCAVPPQPGLKIVVAARQRANATRDDYQEQLGWTNAPVASLDLGALELPAIIALLQQSDPALAADPAFVAQFYRVSEGDPLTCNLLVKALSSGKLTPESLTQRPPGLEAFLRDWVETLRKRQEENALIEELLALCAAAYGPLSTGDLRALAPTVFTKRARILAAVHDDVIARFIITVGSTDTSYVFSHQRLREVFLEEIYGDDERTELQQRLIAYGEAWYAIRNQPLPDYLRQFWIAHLRNAGEWETIRRVLIEIVSTGDGSRYIQPWQTARYAAEGSDTGYLSDLDILWEHAEATNDLALVLRCALIAASLRSRSGNLLPELLVQLVKVGTPEGKWSAEAALETIAQMPNEHNQAACLKALMTAGINLPWQRAVEVARAIADESSRAQVLGALAPHLPPTQLGEALATALTITNEGWRALVLNALVPCLPPPLLSEALAACTSASERKVGGDLHILIPYLPLTDLVLVLDKARAIDNEETRARTLSMLALSLPSADQMLVLGEALSAARAIKDAGGRAETLVALAPHLPPADQVQALGETLAAAHAITDEHKRVKVLASLAPHLPPILLGEALAAARAIADEQARTRALCALIPHLPSTDRTLILSEALATFRAIPKEQVIFRLDYRASNLPFALLGAINPHLPSADQVLVLGEALAAARTIKDERERANALRDLATHLPPTDQVLVQGEALAAARTIKDERERANALRDLATHLPPTDQVLVQGEALVAARAIKDDWERANALRNLATHLPPTDQVLVLGEVLTTVHTITNEYKRADALKVLAPDLPTTLLGKAFAAVRTITNEYERADALNAFVPHLPPALLSEALAAARAITVENAHIRVMVALATRFAVTLAIDDAFFPTLRVLAQRGRPELLSDLTALTPWIIALAERHQQPEVPAALAQAIVETRRCWP
ncbi:MAG: AAA family ATPase [Oscillochloridaceae bacterium umkhey_bin13]